MQNLQKQKIRQEMKAKRNELKATEIEALSKAVAENFFKLNIFQNETFFVYKSFSSEVATDLLILKLFELKKRIFMPKITEKQMQTIEINQNSEFVQNKFGILEPVGEFSLIDNFVAVMPCLAVSTDGNRIGFGGGYYDKFLANKNALKIVLCFDFQISNDFSPAEFDIPVDIIVTDKQIIKVR